MRHERLRVRIRPAPRAEPAGWQLAGRRGRAWLGVRPEDVDIVEPGSGGVAATVYVTEPLGGETVVDLQVGDRVVKALAPATIAVERDQAVGARLDPRRLHVFDDDGAALLSAGGADVFSVEAARES